MRAREIEFVSAQADAGRATLAVVTVTTPAGVRIYCSVGVTDTEIWSESGAKADGAILADGTTQAGVQIYPVISAEPRVVQYGTVRDSGSILPTISLRGRRSREVGNMQVTLRNDDDHFGLVLAQDVLLSAKLSVAVGYRGLRRDKFITRFEGVIQEHILTRDQLILRAETA
jgi:hypothetical protein